MAAGAVVGAHQSDSGVSEAMCSGVFRKIDPSDLPTPGPSDSAYTVSYPAARGPYHCVWALPVLKRCAIAAAEQAAAMERLQFYERTNSPAGS